LSGQFDTIKKERGEREKGRRGEEEKRRINSVYLSDLRVSVVKINIIC